ncbi:MAG: UvrD-helicase domain-containing protein [Acidobacteriota bacterium]
MAKVAMSDTFLVSYSAISKNEQKKVRDFTTRFRADPTQESFHYEPLASARDPKVRSVRVSHAYRAIVIHPPKGDVYLLAWVDHHDEAMAWARDKVFDINEATGALQVVDVVEAEAAAKVEERAAQAPEGDARQGLFEAVSDESLLGVGLPPLLLPSVRALETDGQLDALKPYLPAEAYEALFLLVCGATVEEALSEVTRPTKAPTKSFAKALEHPDTKRRFRLVNTEQELLDMLDAPLEKWRIFLHPAQEALVRGRFKGPAQVLGGAGTGKTVVAMHRARHLAREVFTEPNDKILLTTFTRNLARNLGALIRSLCGSEQDRIVVTNLHAWAASFMRGNGITFDVATTEGEKADCWADALAVAGSSKWDLGFYRSEWEQVVQWQGVTSLNEYRRASRIGRGTRLSAADKGEVWKVLSAYRDALTRRGKHEWPDVIRGTRLFIEKNRIDFPYRAVIVDEAQDLHPEDWLLVKAIAPSGEGVHDNIFLVGDAHQRIYGRKLVLGKLGINIRGRSRRLKLNYRTTDEIRRWALALLEGVEVDDLDGGKDTSQGYTSIRNGPEPEVHRFSSAKQELSFLLEHLAELSKAIPPEEICVVARQRSIVSKYATALKSMGVDHTVLDGDTESDDGDGVRLATMHRVKGLEFSHMVIAGLSDTDLGHLACDGGAAEEEALRERSPVYVSATRAKEGLTVTAVGDKSSPARGLAS